METRRKPRRCAALQASTAVCVALLVGFCFVGCRAKRAPLPPPPATLILLGGEVLTLDPANPRASALAIRGRRIVFVGDEAGALRHRGPATRIVRLPGAQILPGLVDAHGHPYSLARKLQSLDLSGARSYRELIELVRRAAQRLPAGSWIEGRGWDQTRWQPARFPEHDELSAVTPHHRVVLRRVDGHALLVNRAVLELAKIDASSADPPGGRILRGPGRRPSGVLLDNAMDLVWRHLPAPKPAVREAMLRQALGKLAGQGLTAVHAMGVSIATYDALIALARRGELPLRVFAYADGSDPHWYGRLKGRPLGSTGSLLRLVGVKLFADGSLGSRSAALFQPYSDDPQNRGLLATPAEILRRLVLRTVSLGLQPAVHAIGPRAIRLVLAIFEEALRTRVDLRPRIEHAQVIAPSDLPRFARDGVIASMQPTHATSDMRWARNRLGKRRLEGAYAWLSLLRLGTILAFGSDFPVETSNPLYGLFAAVTRQDPSGHPRGGWRPRERLSLAQALRAFTLGPAFAVHAERSLGMLRAGFLADITVLDRPLRRAAPKSWLTTKIRLTVVDGRVIRLGR